MRVIFDDREVDNVTAWQAPPLESRATPLEHLTGPVDDVRVAVHAIQFTDKEQRAAKVAHVLARAMRDGEVIAEDALRILRHELRKENTGKARTLPVRSVAAQASIDKHGLENVPKNGSPEALHSDHVHPLTSDALRSTDTLEGWLAELHRLRPVVCITAAENYALQKLERAGTTGPAKYAVAGVTFTTTELPWATTGDLVIVPASSGPLALPTRREVGGRPSEEAPSPGRPIRG